MRSPRVQAAKAGRLLRRNLRKTTTANAALSPLATAAKTMPMILARLGASLDLPLFSRGSSNGRLTTSRARVYTRVPHQQLPRRERRTQHMVKPTSGLFTIGTIAALGVLAACGTSSTTTSSSAGATGIAGCKGTITVATDLPLTGGDSTDGPFPQLAAQL